MANPRIAALEAALKQNPQDPFPHYGLAIEYKNEGQFSEARERFAQIVQSFPDYVPSYFHYGQVLEETGDYELAARIYKEGISKAQSAGDAHAEKELRAVLEMLG